MLSQYLDTEYRAVSSTDFKGGLKLGTVIEGVRRTTDLSESDAFLSALRIEEQVRDRIRQYLGLPDWYDLPENKDKVLPPWRVFPPAARSHAETIIPVKIQPQKEVFVRPPLRLDNARHPESELDPRSSGVDEFVGSTFVGFTYRDHSGRHLSPVPPRAPFASTKVFNVSSAGKSADSTRPDLQGPLYASDRIGHPSFRRLSVDSWKRRWIGKALKYLYIGSHKGKAALLAGCEVKDRVGVVSHYLYREPRSPLLAGGCIDVSVDCRITGSLAGEQTDRSIIHKPTDQTLEQDISETRSTEAKSGKASARESIRRPKRAAVVQASRKGLERRSRATSLEKSRHAKVSARIQRDVAHERRSSPPGHAGPNRTTTNHIRQNEIPSGDSSKTPSQSRTRVPFRKLRSDRPICITRGRAFWQERPPEDNTKAASMSRNSELQYIMDLVRPSTLPGRGPASASPERAAGKDNTPSTASPARFVRTTGSTPTYSAFGKFSAIMTGNKVWFQDQVSNAAPTFTSFDPMKRAKALGESHGEKKGTGAADESVKEESRAEGK
ncbi:uncharacterized protein M421DRAFT_3185 [Didymella exigua CBS 183.55]|uniref:Uncharacterized protein n=1 Tax=Didymella exigua CBS 183.55 TaxID=1150837 RepID=A0A6A5RSY2_9PLEO|nr:uncharacterized protein M421DRAFT_3185 [Didymella exigua CBS 183.55]KAF1930912.1 hypothetical protein M421DRAFT_3185 [Didymella exigua CBS 183.55]